MSTNQTNARSFNPNNLNLPRVATYERVIGAPLVRVWENVLDWEHLPWLHHSSFDYVELDDGGDWGWRTWSNAEHTSHVELTRVDEDSYVARSYQAGKQVSEIWTHLEDRENETAVTVNFHIADVEDASINAVGDAMTRLYTRLWDEDEAMMQERHQRLIEVRDSEKEADIGAEPDIQSRLLANERIVFQLERREYELTTLDGKLIAHATICPHLLGPLRQAEEPGQLFCPWHGYRFDMDSGDCVYPQSASCRLSPPPAVRFENGRVIATSTR